LGRSIFRAGATIAAPRGAGVLLLLPFKPGGLKT
jgi:hypothetical protein